MIVRLTNRIVALRQDEFSETHEAARSEFIVGAAEHLLRGRSVEIVAPEELVNDRDISFSILGLLATVLGDGVVGDVVQVDTLEPAPQGGTMYGVRFPQYATPSQANRSLRMPRSVSEAELDVCDAALTGLLRDVTAREMAFLPLRWYERGLRAAEDVDRLLSWFVGMEALATRYSERVGFSSPIAALLADERIPQMLGPLTEDYGDQQVERLLKRLLNPSPSIRDRFDRMADDLDLAPRARQAFKLASDARHKVVHGSGRRLSPETVVECGALLSESLSKILVSPLIAPSDAGEEAT